MNENFFVMIQTWWHEIGISMEHLVIVDEKNMYETRARWMNMMTTWNKIDPSTWMKLISSSSIWVGIRPYIVED
jgi:hypothetical protein